MIRDEDPRTGCATGIFAFGFAVALLALLVAACLGLTSCATYEAVTQAPEEFWITLEEILLALWTDVIDIVEFLL